MAIVERQHYDSYDSQRPRTSTAAPVATLTGAATTVAQVCVAEVILDGLEAKPPNQANAAAKHDEHDDNEGQHGDRIDGYSCRHIVARSPR